MRQASQPTRIVGAFVRTSIVAEPLVRLLQRRLVHRAASGLLLVLRVLHVDELAADQHVVGVSFHSDRGSEE
jgi:hypothetical protein